MFKKSALLFVGCILLTYLTWSTWWTSCFQAVPPRRVVRGCTRVSDRTLLPIEKPAHGRSSRALNLYLSGSLVLSVSLQQADTDQPGNHQGDGSRFRDGRDGVGRRLIGCRRRLV